MSGPNIAIVCLTPLEGTTIPRCWGNVDVVKDVSNVLQRYGLNPSVYWMRSPTEALKVRREDLFIIPNGRYFAGLEPRLFLTGILDEWEVAYLGSGPEGLNAESKSYMKGVLRANGLQTPKYVIATQNVVPDEVENLSFPLVLKPDRGTESIGVFRVEDRLQLNSMFDALHESYGSPILIEEWRRVREYTVAVVGNGSQRVASPLEILLPRGHLFLTEEVKRHMSLQAIKKVSEETVKRLGDLATAACRALSINDWARLEILEDDRGSLHIIDVNTLPGLRRTPAELRSYLPICLQRNRGLSYDESILAILATSFLRHGLKLPAPMEAAYLRLVT